MHRSHGSRSKHICTAFTPDQRLEQIVLWTRRQEASSNPDPSMQRENLDAERQVLREAHAAKQQERQEQGLADIVPYDASTGEYVFDFGKHAKKTLSVVYKKSPSYLHYLVLNNVHITRQALGKAITDAGLMDDVVAGAKLLGLWGFACRVLLSVGKDT